MRVKLGEVCKVVSGTTPKSSCPEYWNGTLNWVTPAELKDDSDIVYETENYIKSRSRYWSKAFSYRYSFTVIKSTYWKSGNFWERNVL